MEEKDLKPQPKPSNKNKSAKDHKKVDLRPKKNKPPRIKKADNEQEKIKKIEEAKRIARNSQTLMDDSYTIIQKNVIKHYRNVNNKIDQILSNKGIAKILALAISLMLFFATNFGSAFGMVDIAQSGATIKDVPVKILYNSEMYEVTGVPETVDVSLVGSITSIQMTKIRDDYQVYLDLAGLSEGDGQIVELQTKGIAKDLDVSINNSRLQVDIKKKVSKEYLLSTEFINNEKKDPKYIVSDPILEQQSVVVRASKDTHNQIAAVKAIIDVSGVSAPFKQDAKLVAYDQQGNIIDADIIPNKVNVAVNVTSPSKELPVKIIPTGNMAENIGVDNIVVDHESVTVYGPNNILDDLDVLEVPVSVEGVDKDSKLIAPVVLPNGVTSASVNKINLEVKVAPTILKIFDVPLKFINNYNQLKFKFTNPADATIPVRVKGTQSRLDAIELAYTTNDPNAIEAYMDLEKVAPGKQMVPIYAKGSDAMLTYEPLKTPIEINFTK